MNELLQAAHLRVVEFLAAEPGEYDPSSGHGPDWGKAAPAGLLIWVFLGVAGFLLFWSMNRHIRKVARASEAAAAAAQATRAPAVAPLVEDAAVAGTEEPQPAEALGDPASGPQ